MKTWKIRIGAVFFLLTAILINQFFRVEWKLEQPKEKTPVVRYTLISSLKGAYWDDIALGAMQQAKNMDVSLKCVTLANNTKEGMVAQIDYALAVDSDGLILMGYLGTQSGIDAVARAREAGVPVIAVDACSPEARVNALIGSDNIQAGRMAAKALAAVTGEKACVLAIAYSHTAKTQNDRIKGFKQELDENYKDIKLVQTVVDDGDMYTLRKNLEEALHEFSDINAIVCVGASSSDMLGNVAAVKPRLGDEIKVICFDTSENIYRFIQEGVYDATIAQNPVEMGKQAICVLEDIRDGRKMENQVIYTPLQTLKRENLAERDGQGEAEWIVY